jgi:hypothetical protein
MYNVGRGAERSRRRFGAVSRAGRRAECRAKFNHCFTGNSASWHRDSAGRSPEQSRIHLAERISEHHYAGNDPAGNAAINYQPERSEQPQQLAQRYTLRHNAQHGQWSSWIGAEWGFVEFQPAIHSRESDQ